MILGIAGQHDAGRWSKSDTEIRAQTGTSTCTRRSRKAANQGYANTAQNVEQRHALRCLGKMQSPNANGRCAEWPVERTREGWEEYRAFRDGVGAGPGEKQGGG